MNFVEDDVDELLLEFMLLLLVLWSYYYYFMINILLGIEYNMIISSNITIPLCLCVKLDLKDYNNEIL